MNTSGKKVISEFNYISETKYKWTSKMPSDTKTQPEKQSTYTFSKGKYWAFGRSTTCSDFIKTAIFNFKLKSKTYPYI